MYEHCWRRVGYSRMHPVWPGPTNIAERQRSVDKGFALPHNPRPMT
jgi:hypothetical protein